MAVSSVGKTVEQSELPSYIEQGIKITTNVDEINAAVQQLVVGGLTEMTNRNNNNLIGILLFCTLTNTVATATAAFFPGTNVYLSRNQRNVANQHFKNMLNVNISKVH